MFAGWTWQQWLLMVSFTTVVVYLIDAFVAWRRRRRFKRMEQIILNEGHMIVSWYRNGQRYASRICAPGEEVGWYPDQCYQVTWKRKWAWAGMWLHRSVHEYRCRKDEGHPGAHRFRRAREVRQDD